MSYLMDQSDEELKAKQAAQSGGQQISGQSTVLNSGAQPAQKGPTSSGSFQNLNAFLEANKDNTSGMADKITERADTLGNQAESAKAAFEHNAGPVIKSETQQTLDDTYYNDPGRAVKDDYTATKANYAGPESADKVAGYQDFVDKSTKAKSTIGNLSSGDTSTITRDVFGNDNYSAGANKLDTALLSRDSGAKQKIAAKSTQFAGINSMLDDATTKANSQITANKNNVLANQKLIQQQEQKRISDTLVPIQARADASNAVNIPKNNRMQADMTDNALDQETLDALGLQAGTNTYGLDLNKYTTFNNTSQSVDNVATADERSKFAALNSLMDRADNTLTADGKSTNPFTFDSAKFEADKITAANTTNSQAESSLRQQQLDGYQVTPSDFLNSGKSPDAFIDSTLDAEDAKQQSLGRPAMDPTYREMKRTAGLRSLNYYLTNFTTLTQN